MGARQYEAHADGVVFTLASTDRGSIEMSYVVAGSTRRTLEDGLRWLVEVDFREVSA